MSREELVHNIATSTTWLEVTVAHNDWDAWGKAYRAFNVKYIVPGSRNLINTFNIYQARREVQLTGSLVDFDVVNNTTIIVVNFVSLTSGHNFGCNVQSSGANPPPGGPGRKIISFAKPSPGCLENTANAHSPKTPVASSSQPQPKSRQANKCSVDASNDSSSGSGSETDNEVPEITPAKATRGRPQKEVLKAAAKQMRKH